MTEANSFEDKLKQLELIVSALEKGDRPLESALTDFQQGVVLAKELQTTLKNAEDTLAKVMDDEGQLSDLALTNE
ncbi:exodeoxyribonuclease VII small subunit [Convivina praedatoris]|uniref:Exodeoxyribonuclease 7 small subunit n=1 Tax=Convivina praedatoris TaxID=2880963 RepID=A0ABM9D017_9LACO|nr:exodeoxyribonuclease VII small subunit [Convivina sp. LMG 32447]CAH1850525.1 Exodeoxyribonuclease 7 small subunit [Convivina sp. LMG 32447]CAH1850533.1 Exodeoxyribonuclease 7 small subunit [Convivina sp. LMG 32447]CAH1850677.1 Exodeoxyribonuclease 7 small subunit [Convivina sp. LMG 32447]